ncbi:MAG: chemotaxis protein CheX [Vallitaleaceae bacterium]|nr:chemotaxis protein CheX [Vallitaleaceae bacterium]
MNVEYLNPIIGAASYVLKEMCGLEVAVGKPYLTKAVYEDRIFIVMIGITGELQGQVILGMKEDVGCEIAKRMMMGMPVNELNDMAKSAVSELMNMTMGNAVTTFFNKGVKLDITPPTMFISNSLDMSVSDSKMICVPFSFDENRVIELHIAIKDRA